MDPLSVDLGPKTIEKAERQFLELHGSALTWNTYLKIALLVVALVCVGLVGLNVQTQSRLAQVKPLVIRIDSVGRAEAFSYDEATTYTPAANEVRYFLKQFVVMHFSRLNATLARDFPKSLLFLDTSLRESTMNNMTQNQMLQKYLESMATEETEIEIKNITLNEIRKPPFRAQVDFVKQAYLPISRIPRDARLYSAQFEFTRLEHVPEDWVMTNPLGFQISYFRVDQAIK
jgi:type IV secretory pathway component VirB8